MKIFGKRLPVLALVAITTITSAACTSLKTLESQPVKKKSFFIVQYLGETKGTSPKDTYKTFVSSDEIKRGDCKIAKGAIFRFYLDGRTHWECDIMSTDSGDEWDGDITGGSSGYDGTIGTIDKLLLIVKPKYHFNISDGNIWKHWVQDFSSNQNEYSGESPAAIYPNLETILFTCGC